MVQNALSHKMGISAEGQVVVGVLGVFDYILFECLVLICISFN
jgi:hypothetical protein